MTKNRNLLFILLLLAGGCIEKDLVPGSGEIRLEYDWTHLPDGEAAPSQMVTYVYPVAGDAVPFSFEGGNLDEVQRLARGDYRVLAFNRCDERIEYRNLTDFDEAMALLKPLGTKAGESIMLSPADRLYGGTITDLKIEGRDGADRVMQMNPYVRHVRVEVKTDAAKLKSASGLLTNTAMGIYLKDGKPASIGNGTTQFELSKTTDGFVADFLIFGVDSSAWQEGMELKNIMNITFVDGQDNRNELELDVSGGITNGSKVEQEMVGIGRITVVVDGWESDGEDNSLTETPIRLLACVGLPTKSSERIFIGEYGVSVDQGTSALYVNNKVSVDAAGNSQVAEDMYYPLKSIDLYAYAPYSVQIPARWELSGNREKDDLLWAKISNLTETKNEVTVRFGHLMSALQVEVVRGTNLPESDFEKTEVYIHNTVISGEFDLKSGSVVASNVNPVKMRAEILGEATTDQLVVESCIIPQTVAANNILVFVKVAGGEGLAYVYAPAEPLVFRAGVRKVIKLVLNDETEDIASRAVAVPRVEARIREEKM